MFVGAQIIRPIDGIRIVRTRQFLCRDPIKTSPLTTTESMNRSKRPTIPAEYRASDTVKTVRGEGVIKFVFPRARNGKIAYSVNFANKRLGIIFHENELVPCPSRGHI